MAVYAKIKGGTVENLVEINPMNADVFPDCVPLDGRAVQIGDTFQDGVFYHDGVAIKGVYEQLAEAEAANAEAFAILRGEVQ